MEEERERKRAERAGRVPFWRSVRTRYALTYILVVASILLVLNTYPLYMAENMVFNAKQENLKRQALVMGAALAVSENLSSESVEQTMALLEKVQVTRILVTDRNARILYDTSTIEDRRSDVALMAEVVKALDGYDVTRAEYRNGAFRSRAAVPVVYRGEILGSVYLYEYDADQAEILHTIQSNLRSISIVIGFIALLLVLLFTKALTASTARLLGAIRRVREGEYSHRAEVRGSDEIAQLADEFNQLTGRLQVTEEARRRFVSDASHELKTPLACIRLLTDSILQNPDVDIETCREFVADIGSEADRLTRISEHLLALTRLDAGGTRKQECVELNQVAERAVHMLEPLAEASDVTLRAYLEPACTVLAGADDLYQVAFNLIENAIKYNVPAGSVDVTVCPRGDQIALIVLDTGVGIPDEDIGRVFDRFYRVDKARSRERGGTGLGLSIARDTARLHGGDITVEHGKNGVGSRFTAVFPALPKEEDASV